MGDNYQSRRAVTGPRGGFRGRDRGAFPANRQASPGGRAAAARASNQDRRRPRR